MVTTVAEIARALLNVPPRHIQGAEAGHHRLISVIVFQSSFRRSARTRAGETLVVEPTRGRVDASLS